MKTYTVGKAQYHDFLYCRVCETKNDVIVTERINLQVAEATTRCKNCGHSDYWAYGFYEAIIPED